MTGKMASEKKKKGPLSGEVNGLQLERMMEEIVFQQKTLKPGRGKSPYLTRGELNRLLIMTVFLMC